MQILHEPFFCNFLCCTSVSGSYLVTNRKALILHKQNLYLVYAKSLNGEGAAHTVLTELDDQKLLSHCMASMKSTASYIS